MNGNSKYIASSHFEKVAVSVARGQARPSLIEFLGSPNLTLPYEGEVIQYFLKSDISFE